MGLLQLFSNPALLGGLALAAAPLIIHLLNKRRFEVHEWAAMEFLFQASIMNRRRVRFEDLLILLLRILLIALLVFAVARPLLKGLGSWDEDRRLVVLDDSFSMLLNTPAGTVLNLASDAAAKQVQDATGRSVPVSVQLGSRPGRIGLSPEADAPDADPEAKPASARERWEVLEAVRQVEASDRPVELPRILERLVEEIEDEEEESRRSVAIISDFRRVDWLEDDTEKTLRRPLEVAFETLRDKGLSRRIGFFLIDVGRGAQPNVAITDVRVKEGHPIVGVPVKLLVEVTNFSPTPRSYLEGELEIALAGARQPGQRVHLPRFGQIEARGSATVEVEHSFEAPGDFLVRAAIDADADELPRDNESYCVVTVRDALKTLIVDGDPGRERFAGESGYLLTALAPRGDLRSGILPLVHDGALTEESLEDVDVLVVLNRSNGLSESEVGAVREFVSAGGGLLYFLGNRVRSESYAELAGEDAESSLFPGSFHGEPVSDAERVTLQPTDLEHPAFGFFRGLEGSPMGEALFGRYAALVPSSEAAVLARYDDEVKTPAILEAPKGKGRIAVFNTSADRDWSDWPTHPSYVILLQEWVRHMAPDRSQERNLETGGELRWKARPGGRYTIVSPKGERVPLPHDPETAATKERSFAETPRAGFYEVIEEPPAGASVAEGEPATRSRFFACRRPDAESDLEPLGEVRLRSVLDPLEVRYAFGDKIEVDAFEREQEGELWRWFAITAAIILLVELFTAWWFGRK